MNASKIRIALIGKSGNGKSSSGNTILGCDAFKTSLSSSSVTEDAQLVANDRAGVAVADTPALFGPGSSPYYNMQQIGRACTLLHPGPHAFVIVLAAGRFPDEESTEIERFIDIFGETFLEYCIILVTRVNELRKEKTDLTPETWAQDNSKLKSIVDKCKGRILGFDNEKRGDRNQVDQLIEMVKTLTQTDADNEVEKFYTFPAKVTTIDIKQENRTEIQVLEICQYSKKEQEVIEQVFKKMIKTRAGLRGALSDWKSKRKQIVELLKKIEENHTPKWAATLATGGSAVVARAATTTAVFESFAPVAGATVAAVAIPMAVGGVVGVGSLIMIQRWYRGYKFIEYKKHKDNLIILQNEDMLISSVLSKELETVHDRVVSCLKELKQLPRDIQRMLQNSPFGELCKQVRLEKKWKFTKMANESSKYMKASLTASLPDSSLSDLEKSFCITEYLVPMQNAANKDEFADAVREAADKIGKDLQGMEVWIECINKRLSKC